ncbi:MAG: trimethylamine methyltransferase family protein [Rhizobiaceae bacterium]|nr:trimethylamine methyltransferase family protein [Rhizobiaceae bacterium]
MVEKNPPKQRKNRTRKRTGRRPPSTQHISPKAPDAFTLATGKCERVKFSYLAQHSRETLIMRAFDLLADHGVAVIHRDANKLMRKAGAKPGRESDRLKFPRKLVEEALKNTPRSVVLCGKPAERDVHLPRKDGAFIMRTGTGAHGFVEPESAKYRNLMIDDVANIAKLANGLDQVGFVAHPFCYGVHELTSDIHGVASLISHTDKHIWLQPYNIENVEYLLRIVTVAAGGEKALKARPIASCIMCSFTPLEFKVMDVEALIQCGKAGIPVHACSLPSAGGTAPLSVSGMVLMAVAEILAMVTLSHVLAPGNTIIATPLMFTLDMRTGMALHSCVESLQAKSIAVDVLKNGFGLLTHTYGAGSDTPDVDGQSMAERAMLGQMVAMSGADILGGVGQLECATVFSPVQAVLDDELGGYYRSLIQVPEISDEAMNWQQVNQVAIGSHFLDSPHTLKHCRQQHTPEIFQRTDRDGYEKQARAGAFEAAREKAVALMNAPLPGGLPDEDQRREIAKIVAAADEDIIGKAQGHKGPREVI